jgi:CHAD domain-containing protein
MTAMSTEFVLPKGVDAAGAEALLSVRLRLDRGATEVVDRVFYDTFDGRLHAAGLRLADDGLALTVVNGSGEVARAASLDSDRSRVFASELPAGRMRDVVAPIVEMRALTPLARIHSRLRPLRVLDAVEKTVVRLVIEEPTVLDAEGARRRIGTRLTVVGVRGYDSARAGVCGVLEEELGFAAADASLVDAAASASRRPPGGVSSRLEVSLHTEQRADSAAAALLMHLGATIAQNLPGVLEDVDSEFLHDLRVAVRRTRSAQRQLKSVFPGVPIAYFRAEFRWVQQATGPTRDLDVHLWEFDELARTLPESRRPALEPLRRLLLRHRGRERRRMVRSLRSGRFEALLADWRALLKGLADQPLEGRPDAVRPIGDVAGERIGAVYRRMVKAGRAIDVETPAERLHDLRKMGKELRYLLEFFASLYPTDVVKPMVRTLKGLQDALGQFCDREVQAEALRSLAPEVAALDDGPGALMAMGLLVERLESDKDAARSEFGERFAAFASKPQRALVKATFA